MTGTTTRPSPLGRSQLRSLALPPMLLTMVMASIVLLILVGGTLFCFPEFAQSRWVWPLKPFNTRFLGAIYLTALVGLVSLVISRRVALTRLIMPMMAVFTTIVLMVSCLQLQQFEPGRRATDIWFWLYLVDCVGAGYYCGYFSAYHFPRLRRLPGLWPIGLGVQSGILGVYGWSLLFSPVAAGSAWLWPLDVFHAQLYSAIFLAGSLGSALLSRRATTAETKTLGAIQVTFSSLVLLGIWLVDRVAQRIDWGLWVSWAWVGAIALLGLIGLGLISQSSLGAKTATDT
ncbi:MAG: hypothetical protein HC800_20560 [Phormidesmis sp. RL_2_1]|nr:hypothetical protein [Phormidesmis sp. RL_2_1]